ncbi:hypothetical protein ACGFX8_29645 [Streptomyces sp. NPDC048362]
MSDEQPETKSRVRINLPQQPVPPAPAQRTSRVRINFGERKPK